MNLGLITVHYHQMKKPPQSPKSKTSTKQRYTPKQETAIKGIQKGIFSPLKAYLETNESNIKIIDALHQKASDLKLVTTREIKTDTQIALQEKFQRINFDLNFGTIEKKEAVNKLTLEVAEELKFAIKFNKKNKSSCAIQ